jgi:hypothetical protein
MGIVYVLTNEAMPGLVKIGMTGNEDETTRVKQLYATGVPLPFQVYYACRVENPREVEAALHFAFGPHRINPNREFFRIDPERAAVILRLLDRPEVTAEVKAELEKNVAPEEQAAVEHERKRRPSLNFLEMGIQIGEEIEAAKDPNIKATIKSDKKVEFEGEEMSLTAATRRLLSNSYDVAPAPHWVYRGRSLREMYEETYPSS